MNRIHTLVCSSLVRLARFDHPQERIHRDPEEEMASHYSVNFVERGEFHIRVGRDSWWVSQGTLFLTRPGLVYHCRHREQYPLDACLSVLYSKSFVDGVLRDCGLRTGRNADAVVLSLTNRLRYLYLRLSESATRQGEPLIWETLGAELWAALAGRMAGRARRLYGQQQLAWYAERVEGARALFQAQYAEAHSLSSLARTFGMSPFHFARVFSELAGVPPHHYLLQVRMARASERLRDGASVTETCYACGFNNLSHFIRTFRRVFGVPPSRFLAAKRLAPRPENRKKVQA